MLSDRQPQLALRIDRHDDRPGGGRARRASGRFRRSGIAMNRGRVRWVVLLIAALGSASCGQGYYEQVMQKRIEQLGDASADTRALAAESLGQFGARAKGAVPALARALRDPDAEVRANAAWAMGEIGEDAAPHVAELAALLSDPDPEVRKQAAGALGSVGDGAASAVPALVAALRDESPKVRRDAAWSLGELGTLAEAAYEPLAAAMQDEDREVREHAAEAVLKVRGGERSTDR